MAPPQRREDGDGGNGSGDGGQSGYTYPLRHDGRTITIALNGDVLALAKEDRVFVLKLIDQIEEYGAAGEEPKLLSPGDGADEPESVAQATG